MLQVIPLIVFGLLVSWFLMVTVPVQPPVTSVRILTQQVAIELPALTFVVVQAVTLNDRFLVEPWGVVKTAV